MTGENEQPQTGDGVQNPLPNNSNEGLGNSNITSDAVAAIALGNRIPKFWRDRPKLWFAQFESVLASLRVGDEQKAQLLLTVLEKQELEQVSDLIDNLPATGKYEALKKRLRAAYEESPSRQLQRLLEEIELGDQKPSQLLRKMQNIAKGKIPDETLKLLWINRLPANVRPMMHMDESASLEKSAELADRIMESIKPYEVNAVSQPQAQKNTENEFINSITGSLLTSKMTITRLQNIENELSALREQLERLSTQGRDRDRDRDRYRGRSRSRSRSRTRDSFRDRRNQASPARDSDICYYHRRFGADARKCTQPCSYNNRSSSNQSNS